jgi:hypothetical protein
MSINDTSLDFQVCLEKINHIKRQRRFYLLGVMRTLFGEWCLEQENLLCNACGLRSGAAKDQINQSEARLCDDPNSARAVLNTWLR